MADTSPKKGRIWKAVLVVSLALNMAVVGVVAGFAWRVKDSGPPQRFELSLGPIGAALSRDQRRDIQRILREVGVLRPDRNRDAPQVIVDLATVLRQTPVDADAVRAAAVAPGARMIAVQQAASAAFVEHVLSLSDQERAELADRIEEKVRKGRR